MRELLSRQDRWDLGQILVFWTTPYRNSAGNLGLRVGFELTVLLMMKGRSSLIEDQTSCGFGGVAVDVDELG